MPKKINYVDFYDVCRKELKVNKSYDIITIDGDGTVCAWSDVPVSNYDSDTRVWSGGPVYDSDSRAWSDGTGNYHVIGRIVNLPEYIAFDEELYLRETFVPDTAEQTENVEDKEEFSAKALKAAADSTASHVIFNGLKNEAVTLAKLGKYSASTWVGWIDDRNRDRHVYDAIKRFETLGFKVNFDRKMLILEISW